MRVLESPDRGLRDPDSWDRFVAQDPHGHLLQTWAWGELKAGFGWLPVRIAVEQDGALVAGAQVLYRRLGPLSIGYIPRGPVVLLDDPEIWRQLWRAIHRRSRGLGAILLKVEPPWRDEDAARREWLARHEFVPSGESVQPRRTIVVDLTGSEDEILARMKSKWRYNIRLSGRRGVTVRETHDDVGGFYELMRVTGQRDHFAIHSQAYYQRAVDLFEPLGRATLLMAHYEGELIAGLMAFCFNGEACYMYGASSNAQRQVMPNHRLQWRAMQWARERGCIRYDLWGITDVDPDSPAAHLTGVERFKAGFGGDTVRFVGAYDHVYSRPLNWLLSKAWARRRSSMAMT